MAARELFGNDIPQVVVFDTSFPHSTPAQAFLYALPYHLYRRHRIRRYGFHRTSHRYVSFLYRALRQLTREHFIFQTAVQRPQSGEGNRWIHPWA